MKCHHSNLIPRMIRLGMKVNLRYRVVAAGIDSKGNIISIKTNQPRLKSQGFHAEERLMFSSPRSLVKIIILRIGVKGELRPIDACSRCLRLATKRGVTIESIKN